MSQQKYPPITRFTGWLEFLWLRLFNPTFRACRDKRKAYFEYRLAKSYLKLHM